MGIVQDGGCGSRDVVGMAADGPRRRTRHATHSFRTALHVAADVRQC